MDWVTRWLRPDTQTVGEVMDVLVLEQFLPGLPENIQVWVRRHQPSTENAAVKLTKGYAEADFPRREGQLYKELELGKRTQGTSLPQEGPREEEGGTLRNFQ